MVGREAKQAQVCLLWYSAMPAVWLWEGKQANSQVCLLWYSAMLDATVGREAKCMFCLLWYSRGCKNAMVGREGRQANWQVSLLWSWRVGNAMVGREAQAGKLACLPALV